MSLFKKKDKVEESTYTPDGDRRGVWFIYNRTNSDFISIVNDLYQRRLVAVANRYDLFKKNNIDLERDIVRSLAIAHWANVVVEIKEETKRSYYFFGKPDIMNYFGKPINHFQEKLFQKPKQASQAPAQPAQGSQS